MLWLQSKQCSMQPKSTIHLTIMFSLRGPSTVDLGASDTKILLRGRLTWKYFNRIFRLPSQERLEDFYFASLLLQDQYFPGELFLSPNFVCFQSIRPEIVVVIPLSEVRKGNCNWSFFLSFYFVDRVCLDKQTVFDVCDACYENWSRKGKIVLQHASFLFSKNVFFSQVVSLVGTEKARERMDALHKAHGSSSRRFALSCASCVSADCRLLLGPQLLDDPHEFDQRYGTFEEVSTRRWKKYFHKWGRSLTMVKTERFRVLLRAGIPNALRAELWQLSAGNKKMMSGI